MKYRFKINKRIIEKNKYIIGKNFLKSKYLIDISLCLISYEKISFKDIIKLYEKNLKLINSLFVICFP